MWTFLLHNQTFDPIELTQLSVVDKGSKRFSNDMVIIVYFFFIQLLIIESRAGCDKVEKSPLELTGRNCSLIHFFFYEMNGILPETSFSCKFQKIMNRHS